MPTADDYRETAAMLRSQTYLFREVADGVRDQTVRVLLTAPIFAGLIADLDQALVDLEICIDEWERLANICEWRATECDERIEVVCGTADFVVGPLVLASPVASAVAVLG